MLTYKGWKSSIAKSVRSFVSGCVLRFSLDSVVRRVASCLLVLVKLRPCASCASHHHLLCCSETAKHEVVVPKDTRAVATVLDLHAFHAGSVALRRDKVVLARRVRSDCASGRVTANSHTIAMVGGTRTVAGSSVLMISRYSTTIDSCTCADLARALLAPCTEASLSASELVLVNFSERTRGSVRFRL